MSVAKVEQIPYNIYTVVTRTYMDRSVLAGKGTPFSPRRERETSGKAALLASVHVLAIAGSRT